MNTHDHTLSVVKAGVSLIPMVGGPLSSLIGDYVPTAWQRSTNRFCEHLEARVKSLEGRIAPEISDHDEMSDLLQQAISSSIKTTRENKLKGAANIIANALLADGDKEKLSYTELDHFSKALDGLSSGALHVLAAACQIPPSTQMGALLNPGNPGEIQFSSGDLIRRANDLDPQLVMSLASELGNWNLLRRGDVSVRSVENGVTTNIPFFLTSLGLRFMNHIVSP